MLEVGLPRPEAIKLIVENSEWTLSLYMARDRKSARLGASSTQIARWCDDAGLTPGYFQKLVATEIQHRGGLKSIPTIIRDPTWRNVLLAARAKGIDRVPGERTMQRWLAKAAAADA